MLKKTRIAVVILFILSVVVFSGYRLEQAISIDRTIPVIEMESNSITVSVKGGDEAILEGVTALDGKDGDITNDLFIESRTTFIEKGRFNVTIAVADRDNHVTKAEREVIYSDYIPPQFSLTEPFKFLSTKESRDDLNIAAALSASDVIDGNISNRIKMSSEYSIDGSPTGDYTMEFYVTNSMGDTARLPVTITIYSAMEESGLPEIILSKYLINTPVGTSVDIKGLVERIKYHNNIYRRAEDGNFYSTEFDSMGNPLMISGDSIHVDNNVEWEKPGVYEVKITYTDEATSLSNYIRCYIVVY